MRGVAPRRRSSRAPGSSRSPRASASDVDRPGICPVPDSSRRASVTRASLAATVDRAQSVARRGNTAALSSSSYRVSRQRGAALGDRRSPRLCSNGSRAGSRPSGTPAERRGDRRFRSSSSSCWCRLRGAGQCARRASATVRWRAQNPSRCRTRVPHRQRSVFPPVLSATMRWQRHASGGSCCDWPGFAPRLAIALSVHARDDHRRVGRDLAQHVSHRCRLP